MNNSSLRVLPYLTAIIFLATAAVTWLVGDDPAMAALWVAIGMMFTVTMGSAGRKNK